jgi:hypothetical protein
VQDIDNRRFYPYAADSFLSDMALRRAGVDAQGKAACGSFRIDGYG